MHKVGTSEPPQCSFLNKCQMHGKHGRVNLLSFFFCSVVPVREKSLSTAVGATSLASKGEYVITKIDDLVNWARRVSQVRGVNQTDKYCVLVFM